MTPHPNRRMGRGENLHRYRVTDDDVRGFGEALVFLAILAGVSLFVSVVGFGYRPGWLVAIWSLA